MKLRVAFLFMILFVFASTGYTEDTKITAVNFVKEAVAYAKAHGKDAVIKATNEGKFRDGDIYVTLYDMDGKCLAHPASPTRVGQSFINDKDPDGKLFVKERIELVKTKGSGWQSYKFMNPKTKKIDDKESYNELSDGIIYSCGVYKKSYIYRLNK
jgi:signal transduction histidine kinase